MEKETHTLILKVEKDDLKSNLMKDTIKELEKSLLKREEDLTKVTGELEKRNQKMQRQKIWEREKKGEIEIWR